MAHALQTNSVLRLPTSFIVKMFATISESFKKRSIKRQTYKQLNQLSDRELSDIGLCRGDFRNIVEGNFYRDSVRTETNTNLKGWT